MNFYVTLEIDGQVRTQMLNFADLMTFLALVHDSAVTTAKGSKMKIDIKGEK